MTDVVRGTLGKNAQESGGLIVHLVESAGLYGIERTLQNLLPALHERGWQVALGCLSPADTLDSRLGEIVARSGVAVQYADLNGRFNPVGLMRLQRIIGGWRPRLLHVHGYKAPIIGGAVGLLRCIPTVGTYHGEAKHALVPRWYLRAETQFLRRFAGVVAVSEPIKAELVQRRIPEHRVSVIANGIADRYGSKDTDGTARHRGRGGPLLLFVGRLAPEKNINVLIDVVATLKRDMPGLALAIAGDGILRRELEARVRQLELVDSVRFLGFVEDIDDLLRAADCFVLPSHTEGMPVALLEAMSFALPTVATSVGSIPSVARDGHEALLVPPNDRNALDRALRQLLGDAPLQRRLGRNARQRFVDEYTIDRMVDRYAEFYEAVFAARGGGDSRG
jgi:glycosyltransferase involved in cell wall biosynthesis